MLENVPTASVGSRTRKGDSDWSSKRDLSWASDRRKPRDETHKTARPVKDTFGARLMQARIDKGYVNAVVAADALGTRTATYYQHEINRRVPCLEALENYAEHFGVTTDWLLKGRQHTVQRSVPIVGAIVTGGKIVDRMHAVQTLPASVDVTGKQALSLVALTVQTNDLVPAYRPGDVVFYVPANGLVAETADGFECVVELVNGKKMLRVCHLNADGTWTLECYNAPTIHGAVLVSAARVVWVQRATYQHPKPKPQPPSIAS